MSMKIIGKQSKAVQKKITMFAERLTKLKEFD